MRKSLVNIIEIYRGQRKIKFSFLFNAIKLKICKRLIDISDFLNAKFNVS